MDKLLTKSQRNSHITYSDCKQTNLFNNDNDTETKDTKMSNYDTLLTTSHKKSYEENYRDYPERYYVLYLASFFSLFQNMNWSVFSNTPETFLELFHFDDQTQSHLLNIGSIGFLAYVYINSYITDNISFRFSTLHNSLFVLIGCLLRVAAFEYTGHVYTLCYISAIFMALPGPYAEASGTMISSRWFKPEHRTMSTGIFSILNAVGPMLGSLIGPAVFDGIHKNTLLDRLRQYNYVLTAVALITVITIMVYFPEKPLTPVSPTAEVKRLDYKESFKLLISNKHFLLLCGLTCITIGTNQPLSCLLTAVLTKSGVTQIQSGYIGVTSGVAMIISTFVISYLSDHYPNHRKMILTTVLALSMVFLLMFVGLVSVIPSMKDQPGLIALVGASYVLYTFFTNGILSMSYEMMCELVYPIPESLTSSFCTFWINSIQLVTLIVPVFTEAGYLFLWFVFIVHSFAMALALLYKHSNNRLNQEHENQPGRQ